MTIIFGQDKNEPKFLPHVLVVHNLEMGPVWVIMGPREPCWKLLGALMLSCVFSLTVTSSLPSLKFYLCKDMHETQGVLCVLPIIPHCAVLGHSSVRPGVWRLIHSKREEAEPVHKQLWSQYSCLLLINFLKLWICLLELDGKIVNLCPKIKLTMHIVLHIIASWGDSCWN